MFSVEYSKETDGRFQKPYYQTRGASGPGHSASLEDMPISTQGGKSEVVDIDKIGLIKGTWRSRTLRVYLKSIMRKILAASLVRAQVEEAATRISGDESGVEMRSRWRGVVAGWCDG